jgi:hypothetical protein
MKKKYLDEDGHFFIAPSRIEGQGLFVAKSFSSGDVIGQLYGDIAPTQSRRSIQLGPNRHLNNKYLDYINHACVPSSYICVRGDTALLIALSSVAAHSDEITVNYNYSEYTLTLPFRCRCCPEANAIGGYRCLAKDADRNDNGFSNKYVLSYLRDLAAEEFGMQVNRRRQLKRKL